MQDTTSALVMLCSIMHICVAECVGTQEVRHPAVGAGDQQRAHDSLVLPGVLPALLCRGLQPV